MKNLFRTFIFLMVSVFINACSDDTLKQPLVTTTPTDLNLYAKTGDVVSVNIKVQSDVALSRFYITSKIDNSFQTTTLDSSISTKEFNINYEYQIPASASGKSIIFTYNAVDVDGNAGKDIKRIVVSADTSVILVETAGHQIFSGKSLNHKDAYDLESNAIKYSALADSSSRDIQDNPLDTTSNLSLSWISPAGGKFVRFNGFDYANATDISSSNAYASGAKVDIMDNIQLNDILITKLGSISTNKYVVLKITNITDAPGKEFDSYSFSIKK